MFATFCQSHNLTFLLEQIVELQHVAVHHRNQLNLALGNLHVAFDANFRPLP